MATAIAKKSPAKAAKKAPVPKTEVDKPSRRPQSSLKDLAASFPGTSKDRGKEMIQQVLEVISGALKKVGKVSIKGFGNFLVVSRKARTLTLQGGRKVEVPATMAVKFKPSKEMKASFSDWEAGE